jgi:thioesterase domain-containing protein
LDLGVWRVTVPGDAPVFGLQSRVAAASGEPYGCLAAMVDDYVHHIRQVQPAGPYHLLGWSIGGVIAHAIACALQGTGATVALLALLDSTPPRVAPADGRSGDGAPTAEAMRALLELEGLAPDTADERFFEELARGAADAIACTERQRAGIFHGDVLFFEAVCSRPDGACLASSWAPHVSGDVVRFPVSCEHAAMVQDPHVQRVTTILSRACEAQTTDGRLDELVRRAMPDGAHAVEYTLTPQDLEAIDAVVAELRDSGCAPVSTDFYDLNWGVAARLPDGLRSFLERFHRTEVVALGLVHGFPLDDESVGPTPGHWEGALDTKTTLDQEFFMAMCGLALGDPFTWTTLQSSLMIQNILPIRGDEQRQSGHGSEALLEFHTEDGFHPARCDYLMLLGIRNHDRVPTIVASIRDVALSAEHRTLLSDDRYYILPDDEHVRQLEARHPDHPALAARHRDAAAAHAGAGAVRFVRGAVPAHRPAVHALRWRLPAGRAGARRAHGGAGAGLLLRGHRAGIDADPRQLPGCARPQAIQEPLRRDRPLVEAHARQP